MANIILIIIAVIIIGFIVLVASRPSGFRVARSATIAAPASAVFPFVNELRQWQVWSPWEGIDPAMKRTYEGPPSGKGAIYRWAANKKVGAGIMTITESRPNERIEFKLEFLRPFKATNAVEFTFKPEGSQTVVTWTMTGKCNFVFKAVGLFMNMDKMCGADFEKGLAKLGSVASSKQLVSV